MAFGQDDDDGQRAGLVLVAAILGVVVATVVGFGVYRAQYKVPAAEEKAAQPADVAVVPLVPAADSASVVVEGGVVKFYFATGKSDLADGANAALADAVSAAKTGKKLVVSGYHDATGSAAVNEELSKQRALAVRSALVALGVAEESIELRKPEDTTGTGSGDDARRVEVVILND